jgi:hypothetical protein
MEAGTIPLILTFVAEAYLEVRGGGLPLNAPYKDDQREYCGH